MSAFTPIPPVAALAMMDGIPEARSLLADLAQAGIVKGYARLLEIEGPAGTSSSRDKRIPADVWKRIVSSWKVNDLFANGTVRLPAGIATSDEPSIVAIGIRFDPASVKRAAEEHGKAPPKADARVDPQAADSQAKPVTTTAVDPGAPQKPTPQTLPSKKAVQRSSSALLEDRVQLTKKEAADILNISMSTLQKLINQGTLETTNTFSRVHVTVASIKKHLGL